MAISDKKQAASRANGLAGAEANRRAAINRYLDNPPLCLECGLVIPYLKKQNAFCSCSCAARYNNARKDYTKFRPGPPKKPKTKKVKSVNLPEPYSKLKKSICKHCGFTWYSRSSVRFCNKHRHLYSHAGRAKYWFTFNVFDYPELFDLTLISTIGFRDSQTNPNGISRDHRVSVNESIRYNYNPYYIKHPVNCELMLFEQNNRKKAKSSISYAELVEQVNAYDMLKK